MLSVEAAMGRWTSAVLLCWTVVAGCNLGTVKVGDTGVADGDADMDTGGADMTDDGDVGGAGDAGEDGMARDIGQQGGPCSGVTCSGHGDCREADGGAICACHFGYVTGPVDPLTCVLANPCEGVTCSGRGICAVANGEARCECEPRYTPDRLACVADDLDNDGDDFTIDCDDNDPGRSSTTPEVCDQVDNNCDGQVDEGVCGIWVLKPLSASWEAYPLDPSASGNAPTTAIRAAWDIEDKDVAYVLTDTGYHTLRIEALSWQQPRPLSELGPDLQDATGPGTSAYSVPRAHTGAEYDDVTITSMRGAEKLVWVFRYDPSTGRHVPALDVYYGTPHTWSGDPLAPEPAEMRASWLDVENDRGWMGADPSRFCNTSVTSVDPYTGIITADDLHLAENGVCFKFTNKFPLAQSPIGRPANPPPFDEVGAAFWHRGALYLLRGD